MATTADSLRPRTALISRSADFWLLGGASILLWLVMLTADYFRGSVPVLAGHFLHAAAVFSVLAIVCNHPHFLISYRFGYGRGSAFIFRHSLSLIIVPALMIALLAFAYVYFDSPLPAAWGESINPGFAALGLGFRVGVAPNFGIEALSFLIWTMILSVGWHYSKQVFGCMMVYAHYDGYRLSRFQRRVIKASVFSIAFLNFFYYAIRAPEYSSNAFTLNSFFNIPLASLGLPGIFIPVTAGLTAVFSASFLYLVVYRNWRDTGRWPSANLWISWLAFHVWWVPIARQNEFYFMAIPFFHSLQYLPFAYRLAKREGPVSPGAFVSREVGFSLGILLLVFVGFAAFELVPSVLDFQLDTLATKKTVFFMIAAVVFLNIHHFFIDSVVWKFDHAQVRERLLFQRS